MVKLRQFDVVCDAATWPTQYAHERLGFLATLLTTVLSSNRLLATLIVFFWVCGHTQMHQWQGQFHF